MQLILAVDADRRQADLLAALVQRKLRVELVQATSAGGGLQALGDRIPDLIVTSPLLSPFDEGVLAEYLREMGPAVAHVQTLRIPMLGIAEPTSRGLFSFGRKRRAEAAPQGCDPNFFADEIAVYLQRAADERLASSAVESIPVVPVEEAHHSVMSYTPAYDPEPYSAPEAVVEKVELAWADETPIYVPDAPEHDSHRIDDSAPSELEPGNVTARKESLSHAEAAHAIPFEAPAELRGNDHRIGGGVLAYDEPAAVESPDEITQSADDTRPSHRFERLGGEDMVAQHQRDISSTPRMAEARPTAPVVPDLQRPVSVESVPFAQPGTGAAVPEAPESRGERGLTDDRKARPVAGAVGKPLVSAVAVESTVSAIAVDPQPSSLVPAEPVKAPIRRTPSFEAALAAIRSAWGNPRRSDPVSLLNPPGATSALAVADAARLPVGALEPAVPAIEPPTPEPRRPIERGSVEVDLTNDLDALENPAVRGTFAQGAPTPVIESSAADDDIYELNASPALRDLEFELAAAEPGKVAPQLLPEPATLEPPSPPPARERAAARTSRKAKKAAKKAAGPPAPGKARKQPTPRPAQDEWGLFDPNRCGFAAVVQKLNEVTDEDDAKPNRTSRRVISYR